MINLKWNEDAEPVGDIGNSMSEQRPYLQMRVSELKTLLGRARGDRSILEEIAKELTFRNVSKAKELAAEVDDALASLINSRVQAAADT